MAATASRTHTLPVVSAGQDARAHTQTAVAVQAATKEAVEWVKSRGMMNSATWAAPLAAAPSAVGTMAILLKTASSKAAAGLPVTTREVTGERGEVLTPLPQPLLHGNLEHCSSLGRAAFTQSRSTMDYIRKVASTLIKKDGQIENILEMLEDIEDARVNLLPDMAAVKKSTKTCLERVQRLTEDFQYWYWVICCLKNNVLNSQGIVQSDANKNEKDMEKAMNDKLKHGGKEQVAQDTIKELQSLFQEATRRVEGAEREVDRLQQLPPISEPDFAEELLHAEKAIPTTERELGFMGSAWKALVGESKKDFAARQALYRDLEQRRKEYMDGQKQQREEDRKEAATRLKAARDYEVSLQRKITKAVEDLSKNKNRLVDAQANLAKTEAQFKHLGEQKLELDDVLKILEESSRQLGDLKEQVNGLVAFFKSILEEVSATVDQDVQSFLDTIERGVHKYGNSDIVSQITLNKRAKKRIRDTALQIQGSFCGIHDITDTYVAISDRYILPSINKMDALSRTTGKEWDAQSEEFVHWCRQSMGEIEEMTRTAAERLEPNMTVCISRLQQRAIESTA
ncbi:hypothetical protein C8A00DRAFT_33012 [Chaetomidium leptoderma]|uniref:Uncharacterized protein n=1 Tax=Chaetomidium leptoderma TaxID=669021 RepID=A0AAN6VM98_9PEZI|nr:hypothetical protein C8A00DRAFT_33012 [Chaetomidium leptoderma]